MMSFLRSMQAGNEILVPGKDMIANLDNHTVQEGRRGGFDPETEAALLKKWHAEKG